MVSSKNNKSVVSHNFISFVIAWPYIYCYPTDFSFNSLKWYCATFSQH